MLDRLSIRAKLTAAFALAMIVVLAVPAAFVYLKVEDDLNETLDEGLVARVQNLDFVVSGRDRIDTPNSVANHVVDYGAEDEQVNVVVAGRNKVDTIPHQARFLLGESNAARALEHPIFVTRDSGDEEYRYYAERFDSQKVVGLVIVGVPTDDRDETLAALRGAFFIGAPLAILLASGLGYLLAGRAMAPVSAMRKRASEITLERSGERLPLPRADDEIHQLGETLNSMLDRIEGSLERERAFVADAGHELRTPLAILRAELELAKREGRSPEELRAAIGSAAEETDRLSQLAEDLLVIARSDQGELPIKREQVELAVLLDRVRGRFARRAEESGREIVVDAPDRESADLDPLRIEQALGNLVDNALRHGRGKVEVTASLGAGRVRLEVSDEGSGFPDGFESKAFERFSRADDSRTGGGTGLGLAIVQAIAKAHGGEARASGACVAITVPA